MHFFLTKEGLFWQLHLVFLIYNMPLTRLKSELHYWLSVFLTIFQGENTYLKPQRIAFSDNIGPFLAHLSISFNPFSKGILWETSTINYFGSSLFCCFTKNPKITWMMMEKRHKYSIHHHRTISLAEKNLKKTNCPRRHQWYL